MRLHLSRIIPLFNRIWFILHLAQHHRKAKKINVKFVTETVPWYKIFLAQEGQYIWLILETELLFLLERGELVFDLFWHAEFDKVREETETFDGYFFGLESEEQFEYYFERN